jgi:insulysin
MDVPNPANVNSSVDYYCEVGDVSDDVLRNELALFAHLANEPCFNVLRTKEQLGYIVFSGSRSAVGQTGFRILVQSEKDAVFLESRVEAFLDYFRGYLADMSDEEFEKQRQSLVDKRLEKPKNLHGESSRFWSRIGDGYYDFLRREWE